MFCLRREFLSRDDHVRNGEEVGRKMFNMGWVGTRREGDGNGDGAFGSMMRR